MGDPEEQTGGKMSEGGGKPGGAMAVLLFMHLTEMCHYLSVRSLQRGLQREKLKTLSSQLLFVLDSGGK